VADGILDALEQALAEALSTSIGKCLFDRLLKAARCTPGNAQEVGKALEQLQGIGLWLAVPARPAAHVLARMLAIVSDQELGQLAAQAWPELAVQDERYGAEPAEMRAAVAFINTCDGQALETWRDALRMQLDERKCLAAGKAVQAVNTAIDRNRLDAGMRATYHWLDGMASTLTGLLPGASVLRARTRAETLTLVLNHVPDEWRVACLRALTAHDLSRLKALAAPGGASALDTTVSETVQAVQADMLGTDQRTVEDALAAVHGAIAGKDRGLAITHLGTLARTLNELRSTQAAFDIAMPEALTESLEHVVTCMRGMLLDGGQDDGAGGSENNRGSGVARDIRIVRGMSDVELGELRAAVSSLSPFGMLMDEPTLRSAIAVRSRIPSSVSNAMDTLIGALLDTDAGTAQIYGALRDAADILVRLNIRRAAMGEEISADSNDELAHDALRPAIDRLARRGDTNNAHRNPIMMRERGITGETLCGPLYMLAEWSAFQPHEEVARLNVCMATLTMAWHLERHLYASITNLDGGNAVLAHTQSTQTMEVVDDDALRAAVAGEFSIEWNNAAQTARPCIARPLHALFEQYLAAPPAGGLPRSRSVRLYATDGTPTWFLVSEKFMHYMLDRPGMALAVEGVSTRGHSVHSADFSTRLDKDARLAALGAAMHALRELAGAAVPALTQWMHRGPPDAFAAALAEFPDGYPLHLSNGLRARFPTVAPDATNFRVRREADGQYSIETLLTWAGIASLPLIGARPADMELRTISRQPRNKGVLVTDNRPSVASRPLTSGRPVAGSLPAIDRLSAVEQTGTVKLDPARSRIRAAFALAADAHGTVTGLRGTPDIRYSLAVLQ
jgi:hypothetical protein